MIVFLVSIFFCVDSKVYAYVTTSNTEIECVYGNGVVIGFSIDSTKENKLMAYVKDYPVAKTTTINSETISNISLLFLK